MVGGILETSPHPPVYVLVTFPVALPAVAQKGRWHILESGNNQSKELERCLILQRISIPEPQVSTKYPQSNPMGWEC